MVSVLRFIAAKNVLYLLPVRACVCTPSCLCWFPHAPVCACVYECAREFCDKPRNRSVGGIIPLVQPLRRRNEFSPCLALRKLSPAWPCFHLSLSCRRPQAPPEMSTPPLPCHRSWSRLPLVSRVERTKRKSGRMMGTPINVKRRAPNDDISRRLVVKIHTSDIQSECIGAIKLGRQISSQHCQFSSKTPSDFFSCLCACLRSLVSGRTAP